MKKWKSIVVFMLCFLLFLKPVSSLANERNIKRDEEVWNKEMSSKEQIIGNDNVLYFVNCGASIVDRVSEEDRMGLLSSQSDQMYGVDKNTGYRWGYRPDDINSVKVSSGDGGSVDKTAARWHVGKIEYVSGKSGFYYDFELPNDKYEVIVGFKNP